MLFSLTIIPFKILDLFIFRGSEADIKLFLDDLNGNLILAKIYYILVLYHKKSIDFSYHKFYNLNTY